MSIERKTGVGSRKTRERPKVRKSERESGRILWKFIIHCMRKAILFLVVVISMMACSKNCIEQESCGPKAIIDQYLFESTTTGNYMITNAVINGNCIDISISSSGCSGSTWVTELVDSGGLVETNPPMRLIRLKLTNNELCSAVISKTVSFNISNLKLPGYTSMSVVVGNANTMMITLN